MAIRDTCIVAIEGPHGAGKTTLVHAAVGHFRSRGIEAGIVRESARSSPFFESAFLYDGAALDYWAELHLLGDQLAEEQNAARLSDLLIADRTLLNVVTYWQVRFQGRPSSFFDSVRRFVIDYSIEVYDLVFLLGDNYTNPRDSFREADDNFRQMIESQLEKDLSALGGRVIRVPLGLTTADQLAFIDKSIAKAPSTSLRSQ